MKHSLRHCELEIGYKSKNDNGKRERVVVYLGCAVPPVTLPELELMLEYLNGFEDDTVPLFPDDADVSISPPAAQNDNGNAPYLRETK